MKINLKGLEEDKKRNFHERLRFIDSWVEYIKSHSDRDWSKQQKTMIDKKDGKNSNR